MNKGDDKMKVNIRCIIDTQNVTLKNREQIKEDTTECITHDGYESSTGQAKAKINLYKQYSEEELDRLSKYMDKLKEKLNQLEAEDVIMNRIDIAIDTNNYKFDNDLKLLLYIAELLTIRKVKTGDLWFNTSMRDLQANCIKFNPRNNNSFELSIYNKAKETIGFPYATRIEFRRKRLKGSVDDSEKWIRDILDKLDSLEGRMGYVNDFMIDRLTNLYKLELDKEKVKNFSEFVRKYDNYFYTLDILKGVYKNTGLKGSYKKWLEKFRTVNKLNFMTKTDIRQFVKSSKKAIKVYCK